MHLTPPPHQFASPEKKTVPEDDLPSEPPKKQGRMDNWVAKGNQHAEFQKDVVRAFTKCNVPLSKLDIGSPMRDLFEKYMKVDGDSPAPTLVDPNNLRGTWLPKVHAEGMMGWQW